MEYKDYYQILKINKAASAADIEQAYLNALTLLNIEKSKPADSITVNIDKAFSQIQEAYKVLSNQVKRQIYNDTMYVAPPQTYYILLGNEKIGPFELEQVKSKIVTAEQLVWRSDKSEWFPAKDFTELEISFAPLLPWEQKRGRFIKKALPLLLKIYVVVTICLTILSSVIAINSWETYSGKNVNLTDSIYRNRLSVDRSSIGTSNPRFTKDNKNDLEKLMDSTDQALLGQEWYKAERYTTPAISIPFELGARYLDPELGFDVYKDNELVYANKQLFILRPIYPFFSTLYLKGDERNHYSVLCLKLLLSSFLLLLMPFGLVAMFRFMQLSTQLRL